MTPTMPQSDREPTGLQIVRSRRRQWGVLYFVLAAHTLGYLIWFPKAVSITDEQVYVSQAVALAQGRNSFSTEDPISGAIRWHRYDLYSPGTAILMAPFARAFGWRGVFLVPLLASLIAVGATAHWLAREKYSPLWGLVLLMFLPFLVLSRTGMSDVPSAAVTALVFAVLWRPDPLRWSSALFAGILAGASVLLRETNAVVFAPLIVATLFRYRTIALPVLVGSSIGGVVAIGVRILLCGALFRRSGSEFQSFHYTYIVSNLLPHAVALLLLLPAGLIAALGYRGHRRLELILTVIGFIAVYLMWWYNGSESGRAKQLVIGPGRFYIPLAPLLIIAMANVAERYGRSLLSKVNAALGARVRAVVIGLGALGLALAVVCGHMAMDRLTAVPQRMAETVLRAVPAGAVVVTNMAGTNKVFSPVYELQHGRRIALDLAAVSPEYLRQILARRPEIWITIAYRTDSAHWIALNGQNDRILAEYRSVCDMTETMRANLSTTETVCVWRAAPEGTPHVDRP